MLSKRKLQFDWLSRSGSKRRKHQQRNSHVKHPAEKTIECLDEAIRNDDYYKHIIPLLHRVREADELSDQHALSLCKTFCQLFMGMRLKKTPELNKEEAAVVAWLQARYCDFTRILHGKLLSSDQSTTRTSLFLLLMLIKAEIESGPEETVSLCTQGGSLLELICYLLQRCSLAVLDDFIASYLTCYSDVWMLTAKSLNSFLRDENMLSQCCCASNTVKLLNALTECLKAPSEILHLPHLGPQAKSSFRASDASREVSRAWEALLKLAMSDKARREILEVIPTRVALMTQRPEVLLDFLTRCCNNSNTETLLALSGLACIIQQRSIDYPFFYYRLYEAVDVNVLHKRQRSHLVRLLEQCLSSTHLSGALVASYAKRASRLCLYGPTAGIIAIIPLIYNLVQKHPVCGLMLHKTSAPCGTLALAKSTPHDKYDFLESDPSNTGALQSSLWELATLRSHWHPNAAAISKVVGEQFLRNSFNIEHFLDHTYRSILSTEITKSIKKEPSINYTIERTIFSRGDQTRRTDLLSVLWRH